MIAFASTQLLGSNVFAVSIDAVYFGQTHIKKPADDYFRLVGNRSTLLKVHVTDPAATNSPAVTATMSLDNGSNTTLTLTGPATLPTTIPDGPGVVQHRFDDSFTVMIPKEWIKPGLDVTINAGDQQTSVTNINIGAPTKMLLNKFHIQLFSGSSGDFATDFMDEWLEKMPFAELEYQYVPHILAEEVVIAPNSSKKIPAITIRTKDEYKEIAGINLPGMGLQGVQMNKAIHRAGGRAQSLNAQFLSMNAVTTGYSSYPMGGVGNANGEGLFEHELGHGFTLPHWGGVAEYPYKGEMHEIPGSGLAHAGPTWAFDRRNAPGTFIPPTIQTNRVGNGTVGFYKNDPMQGGGEGAQEPGFYVTHFSDYSVRQMLDFAERHLAVWDDTEAGYFTWNETNRAYTTPVVPENELSYPTVRNVDVYTLLTGVYISDPNVSQVFPPIGPYTSNLIRLFDPTDAQDRIDAQAIFADSDYTLRVTQSNSVHYYMIDESLDERPSVIYHRASLKNTAFNVPVSDGEITSAELLLTPDALTNGLPEDPKILYTWSKEAPAAATFLILPEADEFRPEITMTAARVQTADPGNVQFRFTETTGNSGSVSSGWIDSAIYTAKGLNPGTTYSYTVEVRDSVSQSAPSAAFSATTADPPAVSSLSPANGQVDVIPNGLTLEATFNRNIFAGTGSVTLKNLVDDTSIVIDITNSSQISINGTVLSISPNTNFTALNDYAVYIDRAAIVDTDGEVFEGMNDDSTWTFSTTVDASDDSANIRVVDSPIGIGYFNGYGTIFRNAFSSIGTVTTPDATEAGATYTISGLDLTALDGGTNETIAFDVAFSQTGGTSIVDDAYGRIGVADGAGIEDGETFTCRIALDETNSTYAGGMSAKFVQTKQSFVKTSEGIVVEHASGQTTEPGAGSGSTIKEVNFAGSPFFTTYPVAGNGTQMRFNGYEIEITVHRVKTFADWANDYPSLGSTNGFLDDPDGDGLRNGLESYLGTDPTRASALIETIELSESNLVFKHPLSVNPPSDLTASYTWSKDLVTFHNSGETDADGTTVSLTTEKGPDAMISVTAEVSGTAIDHLFMRLAVTQN